MRITQEHRQTDLYQRCMYRWS